MTRLEFDFQVLSMVRGALLVAVPYPTAGRIASVLNARQQTVQASLHRWVALGAVRAIRRGRFVYYAPGRAIPAWLNDLDVQMARRLAASHDVEFWSNYKEMEY